MQICNDVFLFKNQKELQILDQQDGKIKGNVPVFRFAHCTFGLDQEQVRKSKGISDPMKSQSESPKEFWTRMNLSLKFLWTFGLPQKRPH